MPEVEGKIQTISVTFTPAEWVLLNDFLLTALSEGIEGYSMSDIDRILEVLRQGKTA